MRPRRLLAIALGYCAAAALAALVVVARGPGDPASSGMQAFGDLLAFLALTGLLALLPTLFLARELRGLPERAGGVLSWLALLWGATAPLGALLFLLTASPRSAPVGPMSSPAQALGNVAGLLRVFISPLSWLALAVGRWACPLPRARARANWALGLEAIGVLALVAWVVKVARQ